MNDLGQIAEALRDENTKPGAVFRDELVMGTANWTEIGGKNPDREARLEAPKLLNPELVQNSGKSWRGAVLNNSTSNVQPKGIGA
jgi:hypothetical protein